VYVLNCLWPVLLLLGPACLVYLFTVANMPLSRFAFDAPSFLHLRPPNDFSRHYAVNYIISFLTVCTDQNFKNSCASPRSEWVSWEWSMVSSVACVSQSTFLWRTRVSTPLSDSTTVRYPCQIFPFSYHTTFLHHHQVPPTAGTSFWAPADTGIHVKSFRSLTIRLFFTMYTTLGSSRLFQPQPEPQFHQRISQ